MVKLRSKAIGRLGASPAISAAAVAQTAEKLPSRAVRRLSPDGRLVPELGIKKE